MRASVVGRFGPPEVIDYRLDWPEPHPPGPGEVLVAVAASGVNPADVKIRLGLRDDANLPYVPGREAAGTVLAVGAQVDSVRPRDRVYGYFQWNADPGGLAERLVVPADCITRSPATIDDVAAAAIPLSGSTALQALRALALKRGDVLAVLGGSGGVGTFAVQLAAHIGATVIAVAGAGSAPFLRTLGASTAIDYTTDPLSPLRAATHLLDVVGEVAAVPFLAEMPALERGVSTVKAWAGPRPPVDYVRARSNVADLDELAAHVDKRHLKVVVAHCFPHEQTVQAHRRVEAGRVRGKVVVTVGHRS